MNKNKTVSEPQNDSKDEYIRQLEQQNSERELEVKLLLEITESINNQIQIEELFQAVADRARTLINAETVLIPLLDQECQKYTYRAGSGINVGEIVGESLPIEYGICGWVWRNKRAWWRGVLKELSDTDRNRWEKEAGSVLVVPLFGKKHFLGGISAINKMGEKEFSHRDMELLTLFANSITVTIENALFFQEMEAAQKLSQEYQQELEYLNREQESIIIDRTKELRQSNKTLQETIDSLQETQEKLIQSEKLAALGSLVAGISHEINTPLGVSVTSASYMDVKLKEIEERFKTNELRRTDMESLFSDFHRGFSILLDNLRRASDLIRNFKQVATDQSSDDCREINLYDYTRQIIDSLKPATKQKNIICKNNVDEQLTLTTYPGAIYQVISNFIMNSVTHGFPGNSSESKTKIIAINAWQTGDRIIVSYEDNGVGISENNMNKIFEPFYTTNRGSGSTGLGMSIAYNLITATLQGDIRNKSIPEKGVCFEFDISSVH